MNEKKLCPICGSDKLENISTKETIRGDMGKEFSIDRKYVKCMECGSEGDFFDENEGTAEKALSKLNEVYVNEVLDFFNDKNISFAGIERAVGLPQRTLTKWKNGISTPTAAGIALLKYLRTFPWLIDVAEYKFDYDISQKIFMKVAFNTFVNSVQFMNGGVIQDGLSKTTGKSFTHIYADSVQLQQKYTFNFSFGREESI
jgi:hypothetical protein